MLFSQEVELGVGVIGGDCIRSERLRLSDQFGKFLRGLLGGTALLLGAALLCCLDFALLRFSGRQRLRFSGGCVSSGGFIRRRREGGVSGPFGLEASANWPSPSGIVGSDSEGASFDG